MLRRKSIPLITVALMACGDGSEGSGFGEGPETDVEESATTESEPTESEPTETAETEAEETEDDEVYYDVGGSTDLPPDGCGGGGLAFSHLWVAHPSLSAVAKISTEDLVEEGRYLTRPDGAGDPSRTSVNLAGDMAVANRSGGVTKIYARVEDCEESNGIAGIQTSGGDGELLAWGEEECVAWHTPLDFYSNRPAAWTAGELDEDNCTYQGQKLWTAGMKELHDVVEVVRLNGEDGSIDAVVPLEGLGTITVPGAYGGAADGAGNFYTLVIDNGEGPDMLVRVDGETLDYGIHPVPRDGYGMAVDGQGRAWVCGDGVARFDPVTETWDVSGPWVEWGTGCMVDGDGVLWLASSTPRRVRAIDTEQLDVIKTIAVESYIKGISIDFAGNVWAVGGNAAVRIDPETEVIDTFQSDASMYTYSDMTGFGLYQATPTPAG